MRLSPALEASLEVYRRLLEARFGSRLRALRLFGSQARGDSDAESDADVSVVINELTDDERAEVIDLAFDAWCQAGCGGPLISPLPWSEHDEAARRAAGRRLALDIVREGLPL